MALLLLLAALQSSGIADLVSRLGDDDVDVRERATQEMKAVGLAGRYRLEYSYRFDRAAYKRRCAKNCPSHDDPAMPWNRAVSRPLDASAEFTLR